MSEVEKYIEAELDPKLNIRLEVFYSQLSNVFNEADTALVGLGRRTVPDYPWIPRPSEKEKEVGRTRAALLPFKNAPDRYGHYDYTIIPEEIGPTPENLVRGETYALRGFATSEPVCTTLVGADMLADMSITGSLQFFAGDEYKLTYLDGETLRYDGHMTDNCSLCQNHTSFDSFTLLRADGSEAVDEFYVPISFSALRGMVTVVSEPSPEQVAA